MKPFYKIIIGIIFLFASAKQYAQHSTKMNIELNAKANTLNIQQEITYFNQSNDTLTTVVLNDWNNAFSNKKSPLSRRFSDEFYNGFQFAKEEERGNTFDINISNGNNVMMTWNRPETTPDVIIINLSEPLLPNKKTILNLNYTVKIPSDKFNNFGYDSLGDLYLKDWFLTPALYNSNGFVQYNNVNVDDHAKAVSDFDITLKLPNNFRIATDLDEKLIGKEKSFTTYNLTGKNWNNFNLFLGENFNFQTFKTNSVEVITNLYEKNVTDEQKAVAINRIVDFVNRQIGEFPHDKILISQKDYDRNPLYGLNQLPSFIRPFSNEFTFEIKFLKIYVEEYLKKSLQLDPRKDHWIFDAIQVYTMMQYIDTYNPDLKMFGNTNKYFFLKSYRLSSINFNEQYNLYYLIMARKNLDQPLSTPKDELIKFNEKIAMKYRAGLSLNYLDSYLENNIVNNSIQQFYYDSKTKQVTGNDFENILKNNANKNIDWFFDVVINSRDLIDYKFTDVDKTKDSITFKLKNVTNTKVPVPIYGIKNKEIVFKKWLEISQLDSTFTFKRNGAEKIVLNYKGEVPEINANNNTFDLDKIFLNRPVKFNLMKDVEDPKYNQVLWVPEFAYNYYDGFIFALTFHNKAFLEKKFNYQISPSYSFKSSSFTGSGALVLNQNIRQGKLENIRYYGSGSYYLYAPDATYLKLTPGVQFRFRNKDLRDNRVRSIIAREVIVNKEISNIEIDSTDIYSYSVFDLKYINSKTEGLNQFKFVTDLQISDQFGKVSGEFVYRKIYENNRQLTTRLYAGSFIYNNTDSDYFSFATDRPTDYLFDYNYLGRSQTSGIFSQQYIIAEGGFKSMLDIPYANQWITALNVNYTIWNWIEAYGDLGIVKNKYQSGQFIYDSGICLDLVTNYFQLYFPIYSNNGWEIAEPHYSERIRFMVTLSPQILFTLFTRKWF